MQKNTKIIYMLHFLLFILLIACTENKREEKPLDENALKAGLVKRGEYLVTLMGCNDCHSPKIMTAEGPVPDPLKILSGHPADMPLGEINEESLQSWVLFNHHSTAAVGPWGVSFAANLTPDESGIGTWSEQQFIKSIREGKFKGLDGSRPLLPPMPWAQYRKATDEDLRAIFYYLKSIKPVRNVVPNFIPAGEIQD